MTQRELPIEFIERMRARLGAEADEFLESLNLSPHTSIVLNPNKPEGHPKEGEQIPWHPSGRYLSERPSYVSDPHYHAGAYYSQEASSMLVHSIVSKLPLPAGPFCLDLCAAPGGKSIALLEAIGAQGFLISNEVIRARARILIENIRKWGSANWLPASGHPSSWSKHEELFDLILVDAPCSGEGMFRKEPKALSEWSEENVVFCSNRQASILTDIVPCLKEGGFLIYSTCTYSEEENEDRCRQLEGMGLTPYTMALPTDWGFEVRGGNAFQAYPHRVKGEGFFLSVFVKGEPMAQVVPMDSPEATSVQEPIPFSIPQGFEVLIKDESATLVSRQFDYELGLLEAKRLLIENGLPLGTYKGKDFIPSHELAMSGLLISAKQIELDHDQSIKYLRRETFPLTADEDGWYLMMYEGTALGWAKIAAGRMKNHYPKGWMIRKRW